MSFAKSSCAIRMQALRNRLKAAPDLHNDKGHQREDAARKRCKRWVFLWHVYYLCTLNKPNLGDSFKLLLNFPSSDVWGLMTRRPEMKRQQGRVWSSIEIVLNVQSNLPWVEHTHFMPPGQQIMGTWRSGAETVFVRAVWEIVSASSPTYSWCTADCEAEDGKYCPHCSQESRHQRQWVNGWHRSKSWWQSGNWSKVSDQCNLHCC